MWVGVGCGWEWVDELAMISFYIRQISSIPTLIEYMGIWVISEGYCIRGYPNEPGEGLVLALGLQRNNFDNRKHLKEHDN